MIRLNHRRGRLALAIVAALTLPGFAGSSLAQAPGPESFAKPPTTPLEFWDAADYLVRTGQAPLAVPYLNNFLKSDPADPVLLEIRDRYGIGSVLRLDDDPATKPLARPILDKLNAALRRNATDPARMARFIAALSKTKAEADYAVARLREAGPYAIPSLIRAIADPSLTRETRSLVVVNLGQLERSVVPALVAALDHPDRTIGADVAHALGLIGDTRAIPFLTYPAASPEPSALRDAAREALARLTGRPFDLQPVTPVRLLADQAWRYHRHQVRFQTDPTEVWIFEGDAPAPTTVSRTAAEALLGTRFAREALTLAPSDRSAQAAMVSLMLEKSVERHGIGPVVVNDPSGAFAAALAAGPVVLTDVLKTAINDGHGDLAATAALALSRVADRDATGTPDQASPLVAALSTPDRRVQYAAARALVEMNPSRPFVGSSRVVPVLSRFVTNRSFKAVILDGNLNRANSVASTVKRIGFDTVVAPTGGEAFRLASETADVELILIDPTALQGTWNANDTLTNLRADARTAGIPVFFYGPLELRDRLRGLLTNFPRVGFVVTPTDPALTGSILERQLTGMGTRALSPAERDDLAQGAAGLLATVASRPNSPYAADLSAAEPFLAQALLIPSSAQSAAAVLGDVPGADAQRSLAGVVLDPSRPAPLRLGAATSLSRSIQRFGPLLLPEQEKRLVSALDTEPDPTLRGVMSAIHGALRPAPELAGRRLQSYLPTRPASPPPPPAPPATPKPADAPKPEAPAEKPQ